VAFSVAVGRDPPPSAEVTFEREIRPILKAHCFHCHGEGAQLKGGLDVRLRRTIVKGGESGPVVVPGEPQQSYLLARVRAGEMPPGDKKLNEAEVALIERWIAAGAPTLRDEPESPDAGSMVTPEDREFWSFQPIRRPLVPLPQSGGPVRTTIDAFLVEAMRKRGLSFSPDAEKLTLLRRACFDLTGLPPTPDEVAGFLADEASDAYERLVDRLLASPHYGERWGRHWLDAAGYADSEGVSEDDTLRQHAYRYRDYVIQSFNADTPFDQFITEQLAGDELVGPPYTNLEPEAIEKLVATGFLRMGPDGTGNKDVDQDQARNRVIADTISIVSTSLLGLSVGCAQCHDHRYDPIPQADYYRLRAILEPAYDRANWRPPQARRISLYTDAEREEARQLDAEIAQLSAERAAKAQGYLTATLEKELEKAAEEARDALRTAYNTAADKRTDEQRKLLDDHPTVRNLNRGSLSRFNKEAAEDLKKHDEKIAEVAARKPAEGFVRALTEVPGQVPGTYLFHRGDPMQPKERIGPGGLTVCSPPGARLEIAEQDPKLPTTGRRLAFARWLTGPENPLTARVVVNRVWMHHFGQGIVGTPSDFGTMGERPTHPELLDWLASELISSGWDLKRLHKLIMTSTAYCQTSLRDSASDAIDSENRLYWRMPVRRLEAEAIRDRILAVTGLLDGKMFGPPVPVKQDSVGQIVVGIDNNKRDAQTDDIGNLGAEEFRCSVYIQVRRSMPLTVLQTFDAPVMETNCDRRPSSTVTTQALTLMNSNFILKQARNFAERLRSEVGSDNLPQQVARAWQLALARPASEQEIQQSVEFVTRQVEYLKSLESADVSSPTDTAAGTPADSKGAPVELVPPELQALTNFCQSILSANELLYVD
jgi:hypothetical protein